MKHFAFWAGIDKSHPINSIDAYGRIWKRGECVELSEREASLISGKQGFVTWKVKSKLREIIRR